MAWSPRVVRAAGAEVVVHARPGRSPALLGVHGNSSDHRSLVPLVEHPVLAACAAHLVDLPGHGASPAAPVELPGRYGLDFLARVVDEGAAAIDAPLVMIGHSLGGHALLQALARGLLLRAGAVVVFGTPPLAGLDALVGAFGGEHAMRFVFAGAITRAEAELWAAEGSSPGAAPPWFVEAVLSTDPAARVALGASIATELRDEVRVLDESPIPIALLHAREDVIVRREHVLGMRGRALWRGRAQEIPVVGHHGHWQAPSSFAELIASLAEGSSARHPP
ncbi:MAG: alpha/beta hydrolase [Deltaproteobacteria bacterium]|nr:alpha/beta hydrolase [Deltaproteobacteria bacterium]